MTVKYKAVAETPSKYFKELNCNNSNHTYVIEKGVYEFFTTDSYNQIIAISNHSFVKRRNIGIPICNIHNATFNFSGSTLLFKDDMLPIYIKNSQNITIKNCSIDFLEVNISQGIVKEVSNSYIIVDLPDNNFIVKDNTLFFKAFGKEYIPWSNRVIEIDVNKNQLAFGGGDYSLGADVKFDNVELLANNYVKINTIIKRRPQINNILLFRFGFRDSVGILCDKSDNVLLENIQINYANGMAFLAQNSKDITLNKVNVQPSSGRYFSAVADATHFVNCCGNINLSYCNFSFQMDDSINVHGVYVIIKHIIAPRKIICKLMETQQEGFEFAFSGDEVNFINSDTLLKIETNKIVSIKYIDTTFCEIELENDLSKVYIGCGVENSSRYPQLTMTKCNMWSNRGRGALITTNKKVEISECYFSISGSAIKISGDLHLWYESGGVRDVVITNNIFDKCDYVKGDWGNEVISVDPEIKDEFCSEECYHKNISITNNVFNMLDESLLAAKSVCNLDFSNNTLNKSEFYNGNDKCVLKLINCINEKIQNNVVVKTVKNSYKI